MKVDILEHKIFRALNPKDVETYLLSQHWTQFRHISGEVSLWDNQTESGQRFRIWLPLDHSLGDFAQSMGRVVKTLAEFEDRSQIEILEDFDTITIGDVVRMRTLDRFNKAACTLPLDDGMQLVHRIRNLLSASACSAIEKKPIHSYRRPAVVDDYLKKLRLGQTERGSYIVKVISPIFSETDAQVEIPNVATFARSAVETLVSGLDALHDVVADIHKRGRFAFEPFEEAVLQGVSANLCDAIAETVHENQYQPVDVSVSWSYILTPVPTKRTTEVSFPFEFIPYIEKAATIFREKNPEEFNLEGFATKLERDKPSQLGTVTFVATVNGKERKVKMELSDSEYEKALDAHRNGAKCLCNGDLVKRGRTFWLENQSELKLLPDS